MATRYLNSGRNASSGYKRDRKQTIPGRKWSESAKTGEEASKRARSKRENQKTPSVPKVEKRESKNIPSVKQTTQKKANSQAINEINAYRDSLKKNTKAITPEESIRRNNYKKYAGQSISNSKPMSQADKELTNKLKAAYESNRVKENARKAYGTLESAVAGAGQALTAPASGISKIIDKVAGKDVFKDDSITRNAENRAALARQAHGGAYGAGTLAGMMLGSYALGGGSVGTGGNSAAEAYNTAKEASMAMNGLSKQQAAIQGLKSAAKTLGVNTIKELPKDLVMDTLPRIAEVVDDPTMTNSDRVKAVAENIMVNALMNNVSEIPGLVGVGKDASRTLKDIPTNQVDNVIPRLTNVDMKANRFNGQPTIISQLGDSAPKLDNAAKSIETPVNASSGYNSARQELDNLFNEYTDVAKAGGVTDGDWKDIIDNTSAIATKYGDDPDYQNIVDLAAKKLGDFNEQVQAYKNAPKVEAPKVDNTLRNVDNGYEWVEPNSGVSVKGMLDSLRSDLDSVSDVHPTTQKNVDYLKGSIDRLENAYKTGDNFNAAYEDYRKALNRVKDNMIKKEGDTSWEAYRTLLNVNNPDNIANRFNKLSVSNVDEADLPFNDGYVNTGSPKYDRFGVDQSKYPSEPVLEQPASGNMKVSGAYDNTLKNSGILTEEELAKNTAPENFMYESRAEEQTMAEGARMRAEEGEDFVSNRLNKEGFTAADTDGMMQAYKDKVAEARALDAAGQDSTAAWEEANTIFRKVQTEASRNGQAMQALAKWSRNTPEGMLAEAEHIVNKRIKVEGAKDGKTKQVVDALNQRVDKAAVEKQKPVLTQAAEAYRSYADRLTKSVDTSEYKGRESSVQKLYTAIDNFEKAVNEGNIQQIQDTYKTLKNRAASMSKKGLSIDIKNKDVDDAIDTLVKNSRQSGFEFSPDFQKTFINEASKIQDLDPNSREFKEAYATLGQMVNDEIRRNTSMPKRIGQGVTSYLMNNMLGNFRTLITRNAGGNLGLALTEQVLERPLASGIDRLVAKKTGVRTQAGLSLASLKDYLDGFAKGISEEAQDVKSGLHTSRSGEVNLKDAISRNVDVYKTDSKNKLIKGFTGLLRLKNQVVAHGLSVGDRPFYEAIYNQTLGDMNRMKTEGLLGDAVQGLSDSDYKTLSEGVAQYNALVAVYQNDSKMSDSLMKFKSAIGEMSEGALGFDILSQFSMPFVKTPANVIDRAIDYSPLGLVRNAARTGKETIGKNKSGFNQNRFVNETARNLIGTGLMTGAGVAAYNGAMSGKYSKDKDEKAAQKEAGEQEYALNLPGNYQMDIGWVPVLGSNSVAAAAAVDAASNPDLSQSDKVLAGLSGGGKAMFDQSMFQGLQRLFGSGDSYNSDNGLVDNMISTVKGGASQAIPSLARQIGQVADPYERDLSNGNYDINSIVNNIPFVRETLQPKVDSEGNYIEQNQGRGVGWKILEDMFLPGRITEVEPREMNSEAQRLQALTGNNYAYIPKAQRSEITTENHTPSNKEYTDYQVDRNKSMSDAGKIMIDNDYYKAASPEKQEELLQDLYSKIKSAKASKYTGKEVDDKLVNLYKKTGDPNLLIKRMVQGEQIEEYGYNKTDNLYEYMDKGGDLNDYDKFVDKVTHITESGNKSVYKDDYMEALSALPENQRELMYNAKSINLSDDEQAAYNKGGIDAVLKVWESNKKEKNRKAREKEAKQREDAQKAGVSVEKMESLQDELASYGAINSPTTVQYYNHAKQTIPSLTTKGYAQKLREIGGDDYKITQKELLSYANNKGLSESDMNTYWSAYGQWKKNPYLSNGTWKAK